MAVIDDITRRYRDALITRERTAEAALLEAYALIWERIEPEALALAERIAAAIGAGEEIGPSWLYRQERYRIIRSQIESEINAMTAGFGATVTQLQAEAVVLGETMAMTTLAVQGVTGLTRLPNAKLIDMVGRLSDGSPLRTLLDELGPDASRRVQEALLTGIGEGQGPRVIARRMRDALGGNMSRAMTISRTEVINAHRRAGLEQAKQYRHLLEGWRWMASGMFSNPPPCAACMAMHGRTFPVDTPFESHQNCFIAGTVVSGPKVIGSTERWYSGPVVEIETSLGNRFTVTPNHPILAPDGWVAAGLLNEGSEVISAPLSERPFGQINPNEYQVPALIEDVARSVGSTAAVSTRSVPTAPVDFHGDGIGSEVHIVRADSFLGDGYDTAIHQPSLNEQFCRGDVGLLALTGRSSFATLLKRDFSTPHRSVGRLGVAEVLFGSASLHHQAVGFKDGTGYVSSSDNSGPNDISGDAELLSERVLRFTREISLHDLSIRKSQFCASCGRGFVLPNTSSSLGITEQPALLEGITKPFLPDPELAGRILTTHASDIRIDRVLKVSVRSFSGHVYNLHTSENWYNANGIIAHNCRCTPAAVTIGSRVDWGPTGEDWFAEQPAEYQQKVLSPSKYRAYQAGEIRLSDLVSEGHDEKWGGWRREASLRQAIGESKARQFYQQAAD